MRQLIAAPFAVPADHAGFARPSWHPRGDRSVIDQNTKFGNDAVPNTNAHVSFLPREGKATSSTAAGALTESMLPGPAAMLVPPPCCGTPACQVTGHAYAP